jgi:1-deoxy-D-xylulose-5-phosphate reductoisomerase
VKRIAILGSTGSIGVSALDVIGAFPEQLKVVALAAGHNLERLVEQIAAVRPQLVSIADPTRIDELRQRVDAAGINDAIELCAGDEGPLAVARHGEADLVLTAMVGAVGLPPTLAAIDRGVEVALANKEPLVAAGELCTRRARASGARLLPVDSEHNAIFQCLAGQPREALVKIVLTCSGGPFRTVYDLERVTREQALKHPTWSMGPKITIDSATLMNKGLEVIEARWLFDVEAAQIEVLIHPQSVIHSLIELCDGSVLAQLGTPDMRVPIAYALGYPERLPLLAPPLAMPALDLAARAELTFEPPDRDRFPALDLAYSALARGGTAPAVLNAANEAAVAAFLDDRISYKQIAELIDRALQVHDVRDAADLETIAEADRWAREVTETNAS